MRLYGEVAPAVLRNYTGDAQNDSKAELSVKWQEFTLNYVITPGAIDLQQKLAEIRDTLRSGQETLLTHEGELALVKLIADSSLKSSILDIDCSRQTLYPNNEK